jgi:cell division inhibitor SulA/protein ImuA
MLVPHTGVGELGLILPLLRHIPERQWAVCIAPPGQLYAPALAGMGIRLDHLLCVDAASPAHARWAARQSLNSRSCKAVVMWLAEADNSALRRLQLAAEESATALILIRPASFASQPSPAVLRLALAARDGGVDVRILKRRGPQLAGPVGIDLPDHPSHSAPLHPSPRPSHAALPLVRPLPARSAPADLRAGAA